LFPVEITTVVIGVVHPPSLKNAPDPPAPKLPLARLTVVLAVTFVGTFDAFCV